MPDSPTDAPSKLEIDWLKTLAGALAAVTTAVLLSTLGAVGTLIGAALGSVAATVGSALYAQGLARSRQVVLKAQETALHKVGVAQAEVRRAARRQGEQQEAHLDLAEERLDEAKAELDVPDPAWRDRMAALPWRRIALAAAATFAVAVIALTAFELLAGRSVSSYTGGSNSHQGSTIGGVTGNSGGKGGPGRPHQSQAPSQGSSTSQQPSETTSQTPTASPTEAPSETPSPTPLATPTEAPTPTEIPSPTGTP